MPSHSPLSSDQLREERAYAVGIQAALWGRPLAEHLHTAHAGFKAGATYFSHLKRHTDLKTAADRYVNTPNNVSIDSYGHADLSRGPCVVSVPALAGNRWSIVQVTDMFDAIVWNIGGSRGPEPGLYALTGPDYRGSVPGTMTEIRVPTMLAVVAVRVFVKGEADLAAAREAQSNFHLLPLPMFEAAGLRYEIAKRPFAHLEFTPTAAEALAIFDRIGFAMRVLLSPNEDADPMVRSFRIIGLSVANGFDSASLDEPTRRGLARAAATAAQIVDDAFANAAEIVNGWRYTMAGGRAGHDLALRAALVSNLLGANVPEQILYPNCRVDEANQPLSGAHRYVLRFEKGTLPPVSVFWNLSMYDDKQFFIENAFKRYSIGSTTDGLKTGADGSVTIVIQHDQPADTSNWLPAPTGSFNVTMRLYGSQAPILDGSYRLPAVKRV
jgi:hypothetical protein